MVGGKGSQVGYEKQIKEQFDCVGFVTLCEDEGVAFFRASERVIDPLDILV